MVQPILGVIHPPQETKDVIDRTAQFVAKLGASFEKKIIEKQKDNPNFGFLKPSDPFHAYYRKRVSEFEATEAKETPPAQASSSTPTTQPPAEENNLQVAIVDRKPALKQGIQAITDQIIAATALPEKKKELTAPPPDNFIVEVPVLISAFELDLIKLTAQFTARHGPQFLAGLIGREKHNSSFDFLRRTHYLYPYFMMMVDCYSKVLLPPVGIVDTLRSPTYRDRQFMLDKLVGRMEWEKEQESIAQKQKEEAEKESNAIRQIDWHSFIVVETIDFSTDEVEELPAPLPLEDLLSMVTISDKEKEMWGDNMETVESVDGQIEENVNQESENAETQDKHDEVAPPPTGNISTIGNTPAQHQQNHTTKSNAEGPIVPQAPIKVVKGYQPKSATSKVQATQLCPKCSQQIPVDEFAEHMRIELMDPKHRERERMNMERVKDTSLARPEDIVTSLDQFAQHRNDIFGDIEAEVKTLERTSKLEEKKEGEKVIWDGHTPTTQGTRAGLMGISLEQQIAAIHASKGLINPTTSDKPAVGPNIQPQQSQMQHNRQIPLPQNISLPPQNMPRFPGQQPMNMPPPFGFAPPPHMMYAPGPMGGPPRMIQQNYPGYDQLNMLPGFEPPLAPQPFNPQQQQQQQQQLQQQFQQLQQQLPPPPQQQQIHAPPLPEEEPGIKRARTEDLVLIPEDEFLKSISPGPISIVVSVPLGTTKEELKFNFHGQTFTFIINPTDKIEVVKEKIKEQLDMPTNKQKLRTNQIPFLKEDNSLAFYNIKNGTTIIVSAKERGGKK